MTICAWHICQNTTVGTNKFCNPKCKNKYHVDRRRKAIKQKAIAYKGGQCSICSYNRCSEALEFHHPDPSQKEFNIASSGHSRSWERVQTELDKCVLVCCRCHRELHSGIILLPE